MRMRQIATSGALAVLLASLALGQDSNLDLSQRFLLLATTKTSTMQKELKAAAAAGYRILVGSRTSGAEIALIMEKVATPPKVYEYYLLATTRTSTMERELNEQAARGFRLLPRTMTQKEQMLGGVEILMVMEKAPGAPQQYRYKLLATTRTGTLQKEMVQAVDEGYEVVGMVSRGEHMAVLEKPVASM
jgi:hypothetical protein